MDWADEAPFRSGKVSVSIRGPHRVGWGVAGDWLGLGTPNHVMLFTADFDYHNELRLDVTLHCSLPLTDAAKALAAQLIQAALSAYTG